MIYYSSIWLQDLIHFLSLYNITIHTPPTRIIQLHHPKGKIITEKYYSIKFKLTSPCKFNTCRIYLNIMHLSDITRPDGRILISINEIKRNHNIRSCYLNGPNKAYFKKIGNYESTLINTG